MARIKGPFFSLDARGDLGGALRYQKNRSINYVKKLNNLPSSASPAQKAWRQHYKDVWNNWYGLSFWIKIFYAIIAAANNWPGGQWAYLFLNL